MASISSASSTLSTSSEESESHTLTTASDVIRGIEGSGSGSSLRSRTASIEEEPPETPPQPLLRRRRHNTTRLYGDDDLARVLERFSAPQTESIGSTADDDNEDGHPPKLRSAEFSEPTKKTRAEEKIELALAGMQILQQGKRPLTEEEYNALSHTISGRKAILELLSPKIQQEKDNKKTAVNAGKSSIQVILFGIAAILDTELNPNDNIAIKAIIFISAAILATIYIFYEKHQIAKRKAAKETPAQQVSHIMASAIAQSKESKDTTPNAVLASVGTKMLGSFLHPADPETA